MIPNYDRLRCVSACGFVLRKRFPFGTDQFGRDIFTRVVYGARLSLWIGLSTALLSGLIGALLGVLSAQYRKFDALLMRLMDALMALPAILLAIGLTAVLGPFTFKRHHRLVGGLHSPNRPHRTRVGFGDTRA